jgi:hypothetical protein
MLLLPWNDPTIVVSSDSLLCGTESAKGLKKMKERKDLPSSPKGRE